MADGGKRGERGETGEGKERGGEEREEREKRRQKSDEEKSAREEEGGGKEESAGAARKFERFAAARVCESCEASAHVGAKRVRGRTLGPTASPGRTASTRRHRTANRTAAQAPEMPRRLEAGDWR